MGVNIDIPSADLGLETSEDWISAIETTDIRWTITRANTIKTNTKNETNTTSTATNTQKNPAIQQVRAVIEKTDTNPTSTNNEDVEAETQEDPTTRKDYIIYPREYATDVQMSVIGMYLEDFFPELDSRQNSRFCCREMNLGVIFFRIPLTREQASFLESHPLVSHFVQHLIRCTTKCF